LDKFIVAYATIRMKNKERKKERKEDMGVEEG
jgi:hypothetical protein